MAKVLLPFRYAGGKYYALRILRPFWEAVDHDEYREPLVGGGTVFFAKRKVEHCWLNDIDSNLMTTYRVMADPELRLKLVESLAREIASPERHAQVRESIPRNDFEIAVKYYYLNRTSFSGKMRAPYWGYRPKRSLPPNRWYERIIPCGKKLQGVKLTNDDFSRVITAPPMGKRVLMYIDPPYYQARQENHYAFPFDMADHVKLAKLLQDTDFRFFLSYDDCESVRALYSWAQIHPIKFYYRIDNSRNRMGKRAKGQELVISNYELKKAPKEVKLEKWIPELKPKPEIVQENERPEFQEKVMSPFRFCGSKGRAVRLIQPFWEAVDHDEYREPFFGGGAVFLAKPRVRINWLNDIDGDLVTTLRIMANPVTRTELIRRVTNEVASKQRHAEVKRWQPSTPIEIAHRFYYLNRTSYSGIMKQPAWGYHPLKSVPPARWGPRIEEGGKKLEGTKITQLDYSEVIDAPASGRSVFIFVDPPYYHSDQKRAYEYSFSVKDHWRLCQLLKAIPYKFCLTYDDCAEVRGLYSWACVHPVSWRYHTANASKAERKMGKELIITNY
jgi:DNA adenine methylase